MIRSGKRGQLPAPDQQRTTVLPGSQEFQQTTCSGKQGWAVRFYAVQQPLPSSNWSQKAPKGCQMPVVRPVMVNRRSCRVEWSGRTVVPIYQVLVLWLWRPVFSHRATKLPPTLPQADSDWQWSYYRPLPLSMGWGTQPLIYMEWDRTEVDCTSGLGTVAMVGEPAVCGLVANAGGSWLLLDMFECSEKCHMEGEPDLSVSSQPWELIWYAGLCSRHRKLPSEPAIAIFRPNQYRPQRQSNFPTRT